MLGMQLANLCVTSARLLFMAFLTFTLRTMWCESRKRTMVGRYFVVFLQLRVRIVNLNAAYAA